MVRLIQKAAMMEFSSSVWRASEKERIQVILQNVAECYAAVHKCAAILSIDDMDICTMMVGDECIAEWSIAMDSVDSVLKDSVRALWHI